MFIDEKGRLFRKISIIDIFVVLVIMSGIIYAGYKIANSNIIQADNIIIQFYGEEVPEYAANSVEKEAIVKDPIKGSVFGNLKDYEIKPSVSWAPNSNGEIVKSTKKGYSAILLTVEGKGIYKNDGVTIGNFEYFTGKTAEIRVGNTALWTRIYSIKKKE